AIGDWVRRALREGEALPLDSLSVDELRDLSTALDRLSAVDTAHVSLPRAGDVRFRLGQATAFDEYDILLDRPFVGRKAELEKLEEFVGRSRDADGGLLWRGLILTGGGGSGKSTLLARFVRDLMDPRRPPAAPATLVVLDFD